MKKALIDQLLLGFIAVFSIIIFIATVNDDKVIKNKYHDLEDIAIESINALGQEYFRNMQGNLNGPVDTVMAAICRAENTTNNLIGASDLGSELRNAGNMTYIWRDAGTYDPVAQTYDGVPDGRPDSVTAVVGDYEKDAFWYRFIGKKSFTLPGFTRAIDLNRFNFNVNVTFRGVINAGFFNMVGTYTLDGNGCPQNPQLVLANKDEWANKVGDTIANIEMPQTRMFFIADGYRRFNLTNGKTDADVLANTNISFDNDGSSDCTDGSSFPTVVLSRSGYSQERSDDSHNDLTSKANVYFQDDYLNFDRHDSDQETEHMREIAEKDWGAFVALTERSSQWNSEAWAYYNSQSDSDKNFNSTDLKDFAGNIDHWDQFVSNRNLTPNYDPRNEYVFISEDLASTTDPNEDDLRHDWWRSDRDFTDMSFSMQKLFVPEPIDPHLIAGDSTITVSCGSP